MFGLTKQEIVLLKRLNTPAKVQQFLDSIPFNMEKSGETCLSPRMVIREGRAHCIEGAMFACAAFMFAGRKPLILNLKVTEDDDDHVVALFKENGYWGAVSKTNHAVLRYRDPVYRSVRELAMSYFHEYFLAQGGRKTMVGYSRPISLKHFGSAWITAEDPLWGIAEYIYDSPHYPAVPPINKRFLQKASALEQKASSIPLWNS